MPGPPESDSPGPLIGAGRAADVYDLGGGRVLRRNRNGKSTAMEADVMRHVEAHGYPVPRVHAADGPDLVMDRVEGPTMLDQFGRRPWGLRRWAGLLADLHRDLEAIPVPDLALPAREGPAEALVHGDLHPDNVLLGPDGPVVIDWPNAALGPAGAEVASTWLIMATSRIAAGGLAGRAQHGARKSFVARFLAGCDREAARRQLPAAALHRLGDRNLLAGEDDAIRALLAQEGLSLP